MNEVFLCGIKQALSSNNWQATHIKQQNARSPLVRAYTYNNGRKSMDKYPLNIITEEIYD